MQHIELLMTALEYIEVHLRDEIKTKDDAGCKETIHAAGTVHSGHCH